MTPPKLENEHLSEELFSSDIDFSKINNQHQVDLDENIELLLSDSAVTYVAGHIIRRYVTCATCLSALIKETMSTSFIVAKCYSANCFMFDPNPQVMQHVETMQNKSMTILNQVPHLFNLSEIIVNHPEVSHLFHYDFIHENCRQSLQSLLLNGFAKFFIRTYCTRKNETLKTNRQQTLKKLKKLVK